MSFSFQIDAHNDINTYETSGSKNMHGMCLSMLINGLPNVNSFFISKDEQNIIIIIVETQEDSRRKNLSNFFEYNYEFCFAGSRYAGL